MTIVATVTANSAFAMVGSIVHFNNIGNVSFCFGNETVAEMLEQTRNTRQQSWEKGKLMLMLSCYHTP